MHSLIYFIREAFKGFHRHLSTAVGSIITIFLSLLIIGAFAIGGFIVNNIVSSIESEVNITAYVGDDADQKDIEAFESWVSGIDGVAKVSFTSKEDALEKFRNSMASSPEIIEQLDGQNPLPASFDIELEDPQQVQDIAGQIQGNDKFQAICDNPEDPSDSLKYGQKTVERLFALTNTIRIIGVAVIALLIFIAFIFINNTIRLAILARRREIAIMRLVGASNNFIRGPFLMEGALHAIIGSALAIAVLEVLHRFALPYVTSALMWLPINLDFMIYLVVYGLLVVFGLVIGIIGAMLAMRRYLKI
ncbi:MAG: permease-like cell division protein FtsX [Coriobacteriaceae bacterium]|nr:ABC transporter permease [Coriobacteriaceae bacterium]MDO4889841.1 permease-like cell division protein FtsX [Coriobacteriaceae bacterium]